LRGGRFSTLFRNTQWRTRFASTTPK